MNKILLWALRIIPAVIMLQTLYFKFSASEESIYIFTKMGMEPYGRIGSGIFELIASILLLIPRTTLIGAILGLGVMIGAIVSHLAVLGIVVLGDHGQLFIFALTTAICCAALIFILRARIPDLLKLKI